MNRPDLAEMAKQFETLRSHVGRDMRPLREALQEFGRRQAEIARPFLELPAQIESATTPVRDVAERIQEFQRHLALALEQVREAFDRLPDRTRNALLILADHGWFLGPDLPIPMIWEVEAALQAGDVKRADQIMMEYYESALIETRDLIVTAFPRRAVILEKAFRAHEREDYELSIPVLLAQADGIVEEVIGFGLYKKDKGVPLTRTYADGFAPDRLLSALLEPLRVALPLTASAAARPHTFSRLNRHQVLHGEAVDYATKKFGLQAISLVAYVVWVLVDPEDY